MMKLHEFHWLVNMCTSEWGECARVVLFSFSGKDVGIGAGAYTRPKCV